MKNLLIILLCLHTVSSFACDRNDETIKRIFTVRLLDKGEMMSEEQQQEEFIKWFLGLPLEEQKERLERGVWNMTEKDVSPGEPQLLHPLFRTMSYNEMHDMVKKIESGKTAQAQLRATQ